MRDRRRTAFWILLVSGLSAFAIAMGYRWCERGGSFNLDTVRVRGIRAADSSAVCEVVSPLFGRSIWQIDPAEVESSLLEIPGIDSVSVSRAPLRGLILDIRVSRPVFAISDSSGVTAVSSEGEPLPSRFLTDSIPVIESWAGIDCEVSKKLAEWFITEDIELDSLIFRYSDYGLSVFTSSECEVLLGVSRFSERWNGYLQLASSMSDYGSWNQVDMRYSDQAILREAGTYSQYQGGEL
jgi:cell division septal protein FtsQ